MEPIAFSSAQILPHRTHPTSRRPKPSLHPYCCLPRTAVAMRQIHGLSEIAANYDAVLLDQFGVIHDGQTPYPNALIAIHKLHQSGLKTIILSNSSKRSTTAQSKLQAMGVPSNCLHGIITSGELAHKTIKQLMADKPQQRVLHFNWTSKRGSIKLDEHDVQHIAPLSHSLHDIKVPSSDSVDFILAHGTDGISTCDGTVQKAPLDVLRELCRNMGSLKSDLPFYCANPDLVTVDGPQLRVMPGTLAKDFENAGGQQVYRLGKPGIVAYEAACEMLGDVPKSRILAVGDSLAHDVLGAANADIDSLYIAGGINAAQFGIKPEDAFLQSDYTRPVNLEKVEALAAEEAPELLGRKPKYVAAFFRW